MDIGIAEKVKAFLKASTVNWRVDLTACGEDLGSVDTKRGVFQGYTVSTTFCTVYDTFVKHPPKRKCWI